MSKINTNPIFNKPPINVDKQIELLKNKGLIIDDENRAKHILLNTNY